MDTVVKSLACCVNTIPFWGLISAQHCLNTPHGTCTGATVKTQVYDQLGSVGVWPHVGPVPVDGRCLINSFLREHGADCMMLV